MKRDRRQSLYAVSAPAMAFVFAIAVSSIALLGSGHSPLIAFRAMVSYIDSADSVVVIINNAVPLYVAGLAVALSFKMGLFNIGAGGQYQLAALLAAAAGAAVHFWPPIHIGFIMLIAMVVGGAYAAIAGVLKVARGVNETISTIMLNAIAIGLTAYLLQNYLRDPAAPLVSQTKPLPPSAWIPPLNAFLARFGYHLPSGTLLYGFLPFAIVLGLIFYVVIYRTRFGFDLRMSGANPEAARISGINPRSMILRTIVLSGIVAGLIGMSPLLCDPQLHKYSDLFPTTLGLTGIAIALLGRNHPGGIAVAAVVWATIERAAKQLNLVNIPQEIGRIMLGSLLFSAVIAYEVMRRRALAATVREAAARTPPPPAIAEQPSVPA